LIDMQIVPTAELSPRRCVHCGGNIGPFVDVAEIEIPTVNGPIAYHIYLCHRMCARSVARVGGYAPGKKMQELSNAAVQLAEAEKEKAALIEKRDGLMETVKALAVKETLKDERIAFLEGRVSQLQGRIAAEAQANLALVTGGDAA
jgi:hypothetical protein